MSYCACTRGNATVELTRHLSRSLCRCGLLDDVSATFGCKGQGINGQYELWVRGGCRAVLRVALAGQDVVCGFAGQSKSLSERNCSTVMRRPDEVVRTSGGRNAGTANPSVLVWKKKDSPNCTHDLFRVPRTGSTALYNAVQEDDALHAHVCWRLAKLEVIGMHEPASISHARPIIATIREPIERFISLAGYSGWAGRQGVVMTSGVDINRFVEQYRNICLTPRPTIVGRRKRQRLGKEERADPCCDESAPSQAAFVLHRERAPPAGTKDIYLCVGGGAPPLVEQLRDAFSDQAIRSVPWENVEHNPRVAPADRLTSSNIAWLRENKLRGEYAVWEYHCRRLVGRGVQYAPMPQINLSSSESSWCAAAQYQ